jgi:hypothetical protein
VWLAELLVRSSRCVASVLEKGDFFSAAQQALNQALALEPQYAPAHAALGGFMVMRAYRNGDDPAPGMAHLRQALDSIPLPPQGPHKALLAQAHFYLGMGYRTQEDEQHATACFQTALTYLSTFEPALLAQQV